MSKFKLGDLVRKTKGSQWQGKVVGTYSTELTPEGYAVESSTEKGSVQIYPAAALELVEIKVFVKPASKNVWEDISGRCGGHNGEYDHRCTTCGYTDWFAANTDPNKEGITCPRCEWKKK